MLPRLGSIRGDSRGREGTSVWLERDDRQRLVATQYAPTSYADIRGGRDLQKARDDLHPNI